MKNPFLLGEKIYLRGLNEKDINGNYIKWLNDSEVCKYNLSFDKYVFKLDRNYSFID